MRRLETPFYQPLIYWSIRTLCHLLFKIGWRLQVTGAENIPTTGPILIAANHRSLADPPLIGVSAHRSVHFLAKEELFHFKPFGWLIKNLNAHPLNRGGSDVSAFKMAKKILGSGGVLIVFPEGRRSKTDAFGPAKAGVGMLVEMSKAPVIPAYIHNSGYLKDWRQISVHFGSPIQPDPALSYQQMAEKVMAAIAELKTAFTSTKI